MTTLILHQNFPQQQFFIVLVHYNLALLLFYVEMLRSMKVDIELCFKMTLLGWF